MDDLIKYLHALPLSAGVFLLLWPVSLLRRDASVVDLWWGPGFAIVVGAVWWVSGAPADPRGLIVLGLVCLWSLRMIAVMGPRWLRHGGEDPRYRMIRAAWGPSFWWKSLFIVFLLQGLLQFLIALGPASVYRAEAAPISALALLGVAVALFGLALEAAADWQLDRFKRTAKPGALCTTGLRAHVRHPNYTGEMLFWWGVWLSIAEVAPWWAALSPLLLTFLLVKVSGAPMLAETLAKTRPGYADYAARTPAFLPRLGARGRMPAE